MNENAKEIYVKNNDIWGLPQTYKNINFYPIKINDVKAQHLFYILFQYPKNNIPDKKILRMSYLKFLLLLVQRPQEFDDLIKDNLLIDFLKSITKKDVSLGFSINNQEALNKNKIDISSEDIAIHLKIDDIYFSEYEFDIIREIILNQNGLSVEYIESYDPELEKALEIRNSKYADLTLEDQLWVFASLLKVPIQQIENYTLYQFKKNFEHIMLLHTFDLYSPLEVSGQIKAKNGGELISHFMTHLGEAGRYDSVLISTEDFLNNYPDIPDQDGITRNQTMNN
jgi:hypothetical protein